MTKHESNPRPKSESEEFESSPARRHRLWILFLALVGAASLFAGVQSTRLIRLVSDRLGAAPPKAEDMSSAASDDSPVTSAEIAPPADLLPALDAPLPASKAESRSPSGLVEEMEKVGDALVERFPKSADAFEVKARLLNWLGKSSEAEKCWQRCLEINPEYPHAFAGMGAVAAKKEDYPKAVELLQKAMKFSPGTFSTRTTLAEVYLKTGRAKEAVETLEPFLRNDPRSQGFYLLGQAYAQLGQHDKARESYEAAIRLYPKYTEAHVGLASAYNRLGQKDKAKEAIAKSRELQAAQRDAEKARRSQYDDVQAIREQAALAYTYAARLYLVDGDRKAAERLLRRAAVLAPSDVECRQALAAVYRGDGRTWEAIRWLQELAKLDPKNVAYWLEIGRLRVELAQEDAAEEALRKACSIAPDRPEGYAALANLYLTTNQKPQDALAAAKKAIEKSPVAAHYALLAAASERNQDLAGALKAIARATELAPEDFRYRQVHEQLKKRSQPASPGEKK